MSLPILFFLKTVLAILFYFILFFFLGKNMRFISQLRLLLKNTTDRVVKTTEIYFLTLRRPEFQNKSTSGLVSDKSSLPSF